MCLLSYGQRSGLLAVGRPAEISRWIQCARKPQMAIEKRETYGARWWAWWKKLNPEWREMGDTNSYPVASGSGDWSKVMKCGPNGFLSVLASMPLLRDAESQESWTAALIDVGWVVHQCLTTARSNTCVYLH